MYSFSKTWRSNESIERQKHEIMLARWRRVWTRSAQVPWTFGEWLEHRAAMIGATRRQAQKQLEWNWEKQMPIAKPAPLPVQAFDDRVPSGNLSLVLARPTVWCVDWFVPDRYGGTKWPSRVELAAEGDQRARTSYRRMLPLLRAWQPDKEHVAYEFVARLPELAFDAVDRIPELGFDVVQIAPADVLDLLNSDLLAAIDAPDIPVPPFKPPRPAHPPIAYLPHNLHKGPGEWT